MTLSVFLTYRSISFPVIVLTLTFRSFLDIISLLMAGISFNKGLICSAKSFFDTELISKFETFSTKALTCSVNSLSFSSIILYARS